VIVKGLSKEGVVIWYQCRSPFAIRNRKLVNTHAIRFESGETQLLYRSTLGPTKRFQKSIQRLA